MRRLTAVCSNAALAGLLLILAIRPVCAQYTYDPANPDEQPGAGLRYFGSVKDENGALISGASIMIETKQESFVFVTNALGRFRGLLPMALAGTPTELRCSKPGYQLVRIRKRPGPKSQQFTMQVDCVLRSQQVATTK